MKTVGIDVGGTNADGVLLEGEHLLAKAKIPVDHDNLSGVIIALLEKLLGDNAGQVDQVHLSSTLCTNAIVNGQMDEVGMLVQAGPGLNPEFLDCGENLVFLDGAIDHRGGLIKSPSAALVNAALADFSAKGLQSIGVVTKFSHRNPQVEQDLARRSASFPYVTCGHNLSGLPNFPRRVYTTWINAGLKTRFQQFSEAIHAGVKRLGITAPLSVLKADGGTIPLERAEAVPCESVLSGPSASVMGALALTPREKDFVVLDIGGTTTDIGLFADGVPLMEPYGVTVMGRPTLIRALNTRSVGLGGDSEVKWTEDGYVIGPQRHGVPAAFSEGKITGATPSDAMVVLNRMEGNRERAAEALRLILPDNPPEETAREVLLSFGRKIKQAVDQMVEEVFARPVYTVSALLERQRLEPTEIIAVGGPAEALRSELAAAFELPCEVPLNYEVANAIGAARTRPTLSASLYANSSDGTLSIPEIGLHEDIGRSYSMKDAEESLASAIHHLAAQAGLEGELPPVEFVEREEMNTVRGFSATGKVIALKAQVQPGLASV